MAFSVLLSVNNPGKYQAKKLRTCKALVGARIDYGAPMLTKASKTDKQKLETVQNQFLRTITGARRSTPANLLKIETGVEPIEDRWS